MDSRKERSRAAIRAAFLGLLAEKDYAKITVDAVLTRADVGRATFYAQFRGKDDLVEDFVADTFDGLRRLKPTAGPSDSDELLAQVTQVFAKTLGRGPAVRALVSGSGSRVFTDALRHAIVAHADRVVPDRPDSLAARIDRSFLLHHIAAAFVGAVQWWAWHDFSATPEELAADYLRAIEPLFCCHDA